MKFSYAFIIILVLAGSWIWLVTKPDPHLGEAEVNARSVLADKLNVDEAAVGSSIKTVKENTLPAGVPRHVFANNEISWMFTFNLDGKDYNVEDDMQLVGDNCYYYVLVNGVFIRQFDSTG